MSNFDKKPPLSHDEILPRDIVDLTYQDARGQETMHGVKVTTLADHAGRFSGEWTVTDHRGTSHCLPVSFTADKVIATIKNAPFQEAIIV